MMTNSWTKSVHYSGRRSCSKRSGGKNDFRSSAVQPDSLACAGVCKAVARRSSAVDLPHPASEDASDLYPVGTRGVPDLPDDSALATVDDLFGHRLFRCNPL